MLFIINSCFGKQFITKFEEILSYGQKRTLRLRTLHSKNIEKKLIENNNLRRIFDTVNVKIGQEMREELLQQKVAARVILVRI